MKRSVAAIVSTVVLAAPVVATAFELGNLDPFKITEIISKGVKSMRDVPVEKEVQMGKDVSSKLLGAAPLVDDPELQSYVNEVGRWLALQTERPDLPWRFGVVDTSTVNAFAAPGGYVFVTKGLFALMRSEAELAGVLAHEIAHVLRRHHLEAMRKQLNMSLAKDVAGALVEYDSALVDKLVDAGVELYSKGLDREDEFEADRMGVVIAARGGYDPYGLPAVLLTLHGMSPATEDVGWMFETHPSTGDRLSLLDRDMQGRMDDYTSGQVEAERFQKIRARLAAAG